MDKNIYIEIFGYIGTILVVFSMVMTSINKLRILNIIGSIISAIYSMICNVWPVAIMNWCLVVINIVQLLIQHKNNNKKTNDNK